MERGGRVSMLLGFKGFKGRCSQTAKTRGKGKGDPGKEASWSEERDGGNPAATHPMPCHAYGGDGEREGETEVCFLAGQVKCGCGCCDAKGASRSSLAGGEGV